MAIRLPSKKGRDGLHLQNEKQHCISHLNMEGMRNFSVDPS